MATPEETVRKLADALVQHGGPKRKGEEPEDYLERCVDALLKAASAKTPHPNSSQRQTPFSAGDEKQDRDAEECIDRPADNENEDDHCFRRPALPQETHGEYHDQAEEENDDSINDLADLVQALLEALGKLAENLKLEAQNDSNNKLDKIVKPSWSPSQADADALLPEGYSDNSQQRGGYSQSL